MDQVQLTMPQVESVPVVVQKRKNPEPQEIITTPLKKYEILHRPFDLKFRGKISAWLALIENDFSLYRVAGRNSYQQITHYFYPVRGKWLYQAEVCKKLKIKSTRKLSIEIRKTLLLIWDQTHK